MVTCPICHVQVRQMPGEQAKDLYWKLRRFLSVVPSFGCYTPSRGKRKSGDHEAWPRHAWKGPGRFPLVLAWMPNGEQRPTFAQFLSAYGIEIVED